MLLWVLVDISNYIPELTVICESYVPERILKQTTGPAISRIDGLIESVEEIGELLTYICRF